MASFGRLSPVAAFAISGTLGAVAFAASVDAVTLFPNGVTTTVPAGSNNTGNGSSVGQAFTDDVLLDTITFGGTTFNSASNLRFVRRVGVVSGRNNINAEFGDDDDASDGDTNPFVKAGVAAETDDLTGNNNPIRESTDPAIQDPAIREAFNSLSLNEGIDGEGGLFSFDLIFTDGLTDSNSAVDAVPELVFFERGDNSDFRLQAIVGGTFDAPVFAPKTVEVDSDPLANTGIFINTTEINNGQELAAYGLDLNDFFVGPPQTVFGVRTIAFNNTGPDLYGAFISATDTDQFVPVPPDLSGDPIPFEFETGAGLVALAGFFAYRRFCRQRRGGVV